MIMIKPISPQEALALQPHSCPNYIVEAFNELIIKRLCGGIAEFTSDEVKELILEKNPNLTIDELERNCYTDSCYIFENSGWEVGSYCNQEKGYWGRFYEYTFKPKSIKIGVL